MAPANPSAIAAKSVAHDVHDLLRLQPHVVTVVSAGVTERAGVDHHDDVLRRAIPCQADHLLDVPIGDEWAKAFAAPYPPRQRAEPRLGILEPWQWALAG